MRRGVADLGRLLGLISLAAYLSLAQPGLCPYWLVGDLSFLIAPAADDAHAHHNHDAGRERSVAVTAPALPQSVPAAATLLAALAAAALIWRLNEAPLLLTGWRARPHLPPPRPLTVLHASAVA